MGNRQGRNWCQKHKNVHCEECWCYEHGKFDCDNFYCRLNKECAEVDAGRDDGWLKDGIPQYPHFPYGNKK